jgi:hypothetical protein
MQGREDIDDATLDRVLDAFQDEDVSPELASLVTRTIASLRAPPKIPQRWQKNSSSMKPFSPSA